MSLRLQVLIFAVLVGLGAFLVRRNCRWIWLFGFWLGSAVGFTAYVLWYWSLSPALTGTLILFLYSLCVSGLLIWLVAIIVLPRDEPAYFPPTALPGGIKDTHELLSIPRRYQELLVAHREARKRNWFRIFRPRDVRQDFQDFFSDLRSARIPDIFMRDFLTAAPVLVQLGRMPAAQLSALEAYHRMHLKYVRRRLAPLKPIATATLPTLLALPRALTSVMTAMEQRGMSVNLQWDALWASILAFGTQPLYLDAITLIGGGLLGLIAGSVAVWWRRRRLEAFGDILTVALAHRLPSLGANLPQEGQKGQVEHPAHAQPPQRRRHRHRRP
jgi:hypothetical protein